MITAAGTFNAADWLVTRNAREHPDRRAITAVDGAKVRELTYGELDDLVTRCAAALLAAGIRPEERLLLCMADTPELVALFLAGLKVGAVPVPVSTMMTGKDLAVVALDSRARLLAVSSEFAAAAQVAGTAPDLTDLVICGGVICGGPTVDVPGPRVRDWDTFLAAAGPADLERAAAPYPTVADSPGFWLYTSGTTGTPKGAMHRHGALRVTADTYARDVLAIGPDDVCFSVAKVFFAYGLGNSVTFPFAVGASTVLVRDRPSPAVVAQVLERHRPTLFFAGPTFYSALLAADLPADTFATVRLGVSAGEAFPADLMRTFTKQYGLEILDGIGSTEALHIFLSNRPGRVRPGSTGQVVAGYRLRLEDDDGAPVPDGTPGHLFVAGDSAATGYWCRAETSRQVFRGPWLRTGDTYVRDADGYYTCLGRTDDVLKAGGIWVSPVEVETRLREHPAVAQVAVVSVPDAEGLDKPVAVVVPVAGVVPSEAELIAFCRETLAAYKRPRHVVLVAELPQTATGKLQRYRVRELAAAGLTAAGPGGRG